MHSVCTPIDLAWGYMHAGAKELHRDMFRLGWSIFNGWRLGVHWMHLDLTTSIRRWHKHMRGVTGMA